MHQDKAKSSHILEPPTIPPESAPLFPIFQSHEVLSKRLSKVSAIALHPMFGNAFGIVRDFRLQH